MKKRSKIALLALFLFVNATVSLAQVDTVFWFAAPWITAGHAQKTPIALQLASFGNPTTIRLYQPAGSFDTTFTIPPNTNFTKQLSYMVNTIETTPANTVLNRGIKIKTDFPITATYDAITVVNNPETYSIKGQNGLGLEFVCPFQTHRNNGPYTPQPKSQITIVATDYNTVVWITPKCPVIGHPANITYSIALGYGQSYNIENATHLSSVAGQNLSGTIVVANKPISVTVTDDSVAGVGGCYDLMGDQLVPVDIIGKEYILNKGGLNASQYEGPYIVATENLTSVTITDAVITTTLLNKGDTYFYKLTDPLTYINADKNIYVLHESGFGCELGEAILPPINCAGSNQVSFTRNNAQPFYINVLCKNTNTNTVSSFTLNGSSVLVPASAFSVVPGAPNFRGAQIQFNTTQVPVLSAQLLENNQDVFALGIFHGGASSGCLFHYMSSFLRRTTVTSQSVTPYCVGSGLPINLTGTISGGAITGGWSTNGSGTFGAYTSTVGTVSVTYNLSNADTLLSNLSFSLTSIGCEPKTATLSVPIRQRPQVSVGTGTVICKNNLVPIQLTGAVSPPPIATGGVWTTSGTGFINPGINITYSPTPADLAAGSVNFTLNAVGGCSANSRTLSVSFIDPPVLTGFDGNICTNTQSVVLTSTVVGSANTPTWSTTNGTGFFTPSNVGLNPTYSVSASDHSLSVINFTLALNPGLPCGIVTETVQLVMRPAPNALAPADFTVCANAGLINLNGGFNGSASAATWSTTNGTGAFIPSNQPVTGYTMSLVDQAIGTLTFVLTTDNGSYNCPVDSDMVKVAVLAAPVVAVNSNTSVCENAPIALTGTVTGYTNTGLWSSTGTGAFAPTATVTSPQVVQYFPSNGDVANGSVTLTLLSTNNQGCPAQSASFTAVFIDAPFASFTFPNTGICINSGIPFTSNSQNNGTSNLTYAWNFGDGSGSSSSSNPVYTYTNTGSYLVTLTVTGTNTLVIPNVQCPDTVIRPILVYGLPLADFTFSNACQGTATSFKDLSGLSASGISWQFGDGVNLNQIKDPTHTYTVAGIYNVTQTATSPQGCVANITKTVGVNPQPVAEFGMTNDPTVALEPVYFSDFSAPTGSIVTWLWTFGDEGTGDGPSPTHVYNNTGVYVITLTVYDNNGCKDTISKEIQVQVLPQVPTAFTPNKDNNNDLLFVKGGPFEKMTFRVYNNWGELLFETNDQKIGWDGTKNGKDQPVGVYVWTLVVDMYNNRQVKKNGDVTIIR